MNREEFDKLYLNKAIHCDTKEKAKEFLTLADSVGYRWSLGGSLIEQNYWETYEEETCYELTKYGFMFADTAYFKKNNYQIIEYPLQPKFKKVRKMI